MPPEDRAVMTDHALAHTEEVRQLIDAKAASWAASASWWRAVAAQAGLVTVPHLVRAERSPLRLPTFQRPTSHLAVS